MKIAMVALGCAKNVVNAEQMLYRLAEAGHELVEDVSEAGAVVVNTCGFIESAKQESIDQILELAQFPCKIIVSGCLAQRYGDEIFSELPEVSGLVGCGSFDEIEKAVSGLENGAERVRLMGELGGDDLSAPRVLTSPPWTAYIKIAEGCDNRCSYCVIPSLRGPFRSRELEDIVSEAQALAADGARELIIIAQDTTRYGLDIYGERRLPELLERLCAIDGIEWLRLHYLYPEEIDGTLIDVIAAQPKILRYLDIPIQHCNDRLLTAMNRRGSKAELTKLFKQLRDKLPGLVLRTSLIVGFPGETEEEFEELCAFLREMRIERAGVFPYSPEEGTPAAELNGQIPEDVKLARVEAVQRIQEEVMEAYNASVLKETLTVLTEGYDRHAGTYYGRSFADSPEVDGKVFFSSKARVAPGDMVTVQVTEVMDGDLFGKALGTAENPAR